MAANVRVWDAPTRLFHWALVVCFVGLVTTSQIGGGAMVWHFRFGYSVLTLLLFRLIWGVYGGYWSRFKAFVYSPNVLLGYLRGQTLPMHQVGHNPLGALSVFAMLFFLLAQVVSGLMSDDEIASVGPLVPFVSSTWVNYATYYHKEIGKVALLVLVVSHLCAIAFYYFRSHENLVRPMVTGDKLLSFAALSASDTIADRIRAGGIFVGCTALVSSAVTWLG